MATERRKSVHRLEEVLNKHGIAVSINLINDILVAVKAESKTPEAVEIFREVTARYPAKTLWDGMEQSVTDLKLWRDVITGYIAMGWNPSNVAGMFEYYKRAEIPKPKTYGQKDEALFVNGQRVIRPPQPKVIRMP